MSVLDKTARGLDKAGNGCMGCGCLLTLFLLGLLVLAAMGAM